MRYRNSLTPTAVLNKLKKELQKTIKDTPIYIDGLPAERGVTEYYTLTHTAGVFGQMQRGIVTLIFWGVGIDPYSRREEEMTTATNSLPQVPIVWEPKDTPTTTYLHSDNYTMISQRLEYQFLAE